MSAEAIFVVLLILLFLCGVGVVGYAVYLLAETIRTAWSRRA